MSAPQSAELTLELRNAHVSLVPVWEAAGDVLLFTAGDAQVRVRLTPQLREQLAEALEEPAAPDANGVRHCGTCRRAFFHPDLDVELCNECAVSPLV